MRQQRRERWRARAASHGIQWPDRPTHNIINLIRNSWLIYSNIIARGMKKKQKNSTWIQCATVTLRRTNQWNGMPSLLLLVTAHRMLAIANVACGLCMCRIGDGWEPSIRKCCFFLTQFSSGHANHCNQFSVFLCKKTRKAKYSQMILNYVSFQSVDHPFAVHVYKVFVLD